MGEKDHPIQSEAVRLRSLCLGWFRMITDRQYQQLLTGRNRGQTLKQNAMKAGVSENTARKHLKKQQAPSQSKAAHCWRTRKDPFAEVWEDLIRPLLRREPGLEAVTVIRYLEEKYPDQVWERHLRTLQRRMEQWRRLEGPEPEVYFPQTARPGQTAEIDWTHLGALGITIAGEKIKLLLFHLVLIYSNWQWGTLCRSESFASLRRGVQLSLRKMGGVPFHIKSDQSSSATHALRRSGSARGFNCRYQQFCDHWGMIPRTIEVAKPNQNGDVESLNGHFKNRLDQALMLRGSRDFETVEQLQNFIEELLHQLNQKVEARLCEEIKVMKPLVRYDLPEFETTLVRVGRSSTVQIDKTPYSVPCRFIGANLRVHLYEDHIEAFHQQQQVLRAPRSRQPHIDYRHIIEKLQRKPGAFEQYRWREALYPTPVFRAAFDQMERKHGTERAIPEYLRILSLCLDHGESTVANLIEEILQQPKSILSSDEVKNLLGTYQQMREEFNQQPDLVPSLDEYNQLLCSEVEL